MYQEMAVNRENLQKLENFNIINECADNFTTVNTEQIKADLDEAYASTKLIVIWFWVIVSAFLFQLCIVFYYKIHHGRWCPRIPDDDIDSYKKVTSSGLDS